MGFRFKAGLVLGLGGLGLDFDTVFFSGFRFWVQGSLQVPFEGSFQGHCKRCYKGVICVGGLNKNRDWGKMQNRNSREIIQKYYSELFRNIYYGIRIRVVV